MPVSRALEQKAAATMKANRYAGWFMVIVGLLVMLWGLVMPISPSARPFAPPPFEASKHKEIVLPAADLDKFVGRYDFGNDFVVRVTHDGPTLQVFREHSPGARPAPIYPEGPRAFFWKAVEAQIRFYGRCRRRGNRGRVPANRGLATGQAADALSAAALAVRLKGAKRSRGGS